MMHHLKVDRRYFLGLLIVLMITPMLFTSIAQIIDNYILQSTGRIEYEYVNPDAKLHIGDVLLGESPSFFYDESGKLVTLRMYQSGHRDSNFYLNQIPYGSYVGNTWADASIEFAKDAQFNCFRIHIFFGNQYVPTSEWLFPERRIVNTENLELFVDHLEKLANNDIYYVLDGYWHAANNDYWMLKELDGTGPNSGGLLWNKTVQDDFIWCWDVILDTIKERGDNTWNHFVFIEPWSEWALGSSTIGTVITHSQDPYRYNQSNLGDKGFGNSSLVSWQNWLKNEYNDDLNKLKEVWDYGPGTPIEIWNASGLESESFEGIIMPMRSQKYSFNRAYDFDRWFTECYVNFTRDASLSWKTDHSDMYVAWDGWQSILSSNNLSPEKIYPKIAATFEYSDILDGHDFASVSENYNYVFGDRYLYNQLQIATIARTLGKPYITGEVGPVTSSSVGYDPAQNLHNIGCWNITLQKAIRYGYAGWCPYWVSYYHSYETAKYTRIQVCEDRLPYVRDLNIQYKAAENWIDNNQYSPIMLLTSAGSHFSAYSSESGERFAIKLFDQAGYIPKYWGFSYDAELFFPEVIPEDVEVIVLGDLVHSEVYSKLELEMVNDWLNSDPNHKLILTHTMSYDLLLNGTTRWEDVIDTEIFPLSLVKYGTSYSSVYSATDTYVDVEGTDVFLSRTNNYHSGYTTNFVENYITGDYLINYTGTDIPAVIINDRVAWIKDVIAYQCGNPNALAYSDSTNGYLIIHKILDYWNIKPVADVTDSYPEVGYGFSTIEPTYAILSSYSLDHEKTGLINSSINIPRTGLDETKDYILFSTKTKSTVHKTITELEKGVTSSLGILGHETYIIREDDQLNYLYSNSYLESENKISQENITWIFKNTIYSDSETAYFYFPYAMDSDWKIKIDNIIILDAIDYYDSENKLIVLPFTPYDEVSINIYKIS